MLSSILESVLLVPLDLWVFGCEHVQCPEDTPNAQSLALPMPTTAKKPTLARVPLPFMPLPQSFT
jgi:hypothetical protein